MAGRKNVLTSYHLIVAGDMSATLITSAATNIQFLDNIGIQTNFTGTPTGNFSVEVSADYQQTPYGETTNSGTWNALTLSPSPAAAGSAGSNYIDLNQLSAPWIRVKYTKVSGTGTLDVYITGKEV